MELDKPLYIVCTVLEAVGLLCVLITLDTQCVLAGEITLLVNVYMLVIFSVLITDIFYSIFVFCSSVGRDPMAVLFNFVGGLLCIIGACTLLVVMSVLCGNPAQDLIIIAGVLTLIAGLCHFLNGYLRQKKLPDDDNFLKFNRPTNILNEV